jgi:hypothetical protein
MSAKDIILEWVAPVAGGIVGTAMFAAPLKAVLRARKERVLGDLNPMPFPCIAGNCAGWVAYAWVQKDALIFWPNEIGLLLGLFFTLSAYSLADTKVGYDPHTCRRYLSQSLPTTNRTAVLQRPASRCPSQH